MDIVAFRRRVLEIQAELAALDPSQSDATARASALGTELDELAAEQRRRTARMAARAFGRSVTPTGLDTPVDTLSTLVDRVEAATAPEGPAPAEEPAPPERPLHGDQPRTSEATDREKPA